MSLNTITPLTEYVFKVASIDNLDLGDSKYAIAITFEYQNPDELSLAEQNYEFIQTEDLTAVGVAVQPYGALVMNTLEPTSASDIGILTLSLKTAGGILESDVTISDILTEGVGTEVTFATDEGGGDEPNVG